MVPEINALVKEINVCFLKSISLIKIVFGMIDKALKINGGEVADLEERVTKRKRQMEKGK